MAGYLLRAQSARVLSIGAIIVAAAALGGCAEWHEPPTARIKEASVRPKTKRVASAIYRAPAPAKVVTTPPADDSPKTAIIAAPAPKPSPAPSQPAVVAAPAPLPPTPPAPTAGAQPPPAPPPTPAPALPPREVAKSATPNPKLRLDATASAPSGAAIATPTGPGATTAATVSPPPPHALWDVVPVLYGTDRKRRDTDKRIAYSSERARKLELGHVMVTVPKVHQVPFIERPWALRLPVFNVVLYEASEDPRKHFTIREIQAVSQDDFIALARTRLGTTARFKDQALVFVHGYNTGFDFAVYRAAQIAYDLRFDGVPFVYSWPSGGDFTSYTYDRESAEQAEPYLRRFLELVISETGATSVSIIAHSMGNKPLLHALAEIKRSVPAAVKLNQIILAAPDIDRDGFENIVSQIKGLGRGITLYASSNDRAMAASRRFHGGVARAGDVPRGGPIVIAGIDTIDVTATSTDIVALNHSGYAENSAILKDIELLLRTGLRPPEQRMPTIAKVGTPTGDFWRYPAVRTGAP